MVGPTHMKPAKPEDADLVWSDPSKCLCKLCMHKHTHICMYYPLDVSLPASVVRALLCGSPPPKKKKKKYIYIYIYT